MTLDRVVREAKAMRNARDVQAAIDRCGSRAELLALFHGVLEAQRPKCIEVGESLGVLLAFGEHGALPPEAINQLQVLRVGIQEIAWSVDQVDQGICAAASDTWRNDGWRGLVRKVLSLFRAV